jgi:hypothetical protein
MICKSKQNHTLVYIDQSQVTSVLKSKWLEQQFIVGCHFGPSLNLSLKLLTADLRQGTSSIPQLSHDAIPPCQEAHAVPLML